MQRRHLGTAGAVPAVGLGCMGMSGMYGPSDRAECIATIHAALALSDLFGDSRFPEPVLKVQNCSSGRPYSPVLISNLWEGRLPSHRDH